MRIYSRSRVVLAVLAALLLAPPAGAIIRGGLDGPDQSCVEEVKIANGLSRDPTTCTANDVTFVLVGLGVQDDGCVSSADTVSILLTAIVENTTAQDRYDVGMYVATDGDIDHSGGLWEVGVDESGDGARSGICSRQAVNLTAYVDSSTPLAIGGICGPGLTCSMDTCPPMDLAGLDDAIADGPYLSAETNQALSTPDWCGGLRDGNNDGCDEVAPLGGPDRWDNSIIDFPEPVVLPCTDLYSGTDQTGNPTGTSDGYVEIPTCATWGNQANEVHSNLGTPGENTTCDSEEELVPGTPAKCRCELVNSTIPVSELSLACNPCTISNDQDGDGVLDPGDTATCSATYTNTRATLCDPGTAEQQALPERERCGTASFLRYKVGYDGGNGTVSGLSVTGNDSAVDDSVNDQIVWTPSSDSPNYGETSGIVGAGETGTLTWSYTLDNDASVPSGTIQFTTQSFWSDVSGFSPEVGQDVLTCSTQVSATPVTLAHFEAHQKGGTVRFDWSTVTQTGNLGFNLYRMDGDDVTRLNRQMIPSTAVDSTAPQSYTFTASGAGGGVYILEDVAVDGVKRHHGPFELGQKHGKRPQLRPVDWPQLRAEHEQKARGRARGSGTSRGGGRATVRESTSTVGPIRLRVAVTGLYRVTYDQLLAAGFDLAGVRAADLAVTESGNPVAVRVESAPRFGPGAFIEFWGEAAHTLYTDERVYQLLISKRNAARVDFAGPPPSAAGAAASYRETALAGTDRIYSFSSPLDDPWLDSFMLTDTSPDSWNFTVMVDHLAAGAAPASASARLWGVTSWPGEAPDHHVIAEFNGSPLGELVFDGVAPAILTGDVSVFEGTNTLTVHLPGDTGFDYDMLAYDSLEVNYPREFVAGDDQLSFHGSGAAFEVAGFSGDEIVAYRVGPGPATRLAVEAIADGGHWTARFAGQGDGRYAVATVSALRVPGIEQGRVSPGLPRGRADYLVVSHPDFLDGLGDFVADKRSQGLDVVVTDVEDIYAAYSHGNLDPRAIRDYIRDAADRLGIRYVLLVGGDTYDYKDFGGSGSVSFIPSLYAATGHIVNWAPSDALYADVDDDNVVDLALGRWPVRSSDELAEVIAKTLQYEAKGYSGTAMLAADFYDPAGAVSFLRHSEKFALSLGGSWSIAKAYLDQSSVAVARETVIAAINEGVALASYVGHSGPTRWTFDGLFDTADASALENGARPTVVMQWGCWNTYHVEPAFDTLGHVLLLGADRGAAAVVGSATLSAAASSEALGELLVPLATRQGQTLGSAIVEAKRQLAEANPERIDELLDVLLGWTLLGDPALVIQP